jgi:molecular chaperone DnaJ
MQQDPYSILGVNKNSNPDEIKKAYRKLAHQYHPDKNPNNKEAENKFKQINNAYEILGDPAKKSQFDRFGGNINSNYSPGGNPQGNTADGFSNVEFNFGNMDFSGVEEIFETFFGGNPFGNTGGSGRSNSGRKRGVDLELELNITLNEVAHGVKKSFDHKHKTKCSNCDGKGYEKGSTRKQCPTCNGKKTIYQRVQTIFGTVQQEIICPTCTGKGEVYEKQCKVCTGSGFQEAVEKIEVEIPAGIDSGQKIRIPGKGEIGYQGSEPGDLYIKVKVKTDKYFTRNGLDIFSNIEINFLDLLLGTVRNVPTIWGDVEINIPQFTDPSRELRLKNHGLPKLNNGNIKGDHYLKMVIKMPSSLSKTQKETLEKIRTELSK